MVINLKKVPPFIPPLKINGRDIDRVTYARRLGNICLVTLNEAHTLTKFTLKHSKDFIFSHAWRVQVLRKMNYRSIIRSVVEYACSAWSTGITKEQSDSLVQIQKCAMYIIAPHLQYKKSHHKG